MDIHEFQAKELLATNGVKLPRGGIAYSPEQARYRASEIGGDAWVVKAQIHSGARGKAGGIILCRSEEEVEAAADSLIGRRLVTNQTGPKGNLVNRLYIEETVQIDRELYLGIVLDRKAERIKIMASASGGMEIEEIAAKEPDSLIQITVDPGGGMQRFQARELAFGLGLDGSMVTKATDTLLACYRAFRDFDATMLEINPLVVSKGELVALDADVAQLRQPADVDQELRRAEAHLHDRDQGVAAGQDAGVLALLGEQRDGVVEGVGAGVVEREGDHAPASPREKAGAVRSASDSASAFCAASGSLPAATSTARTMLW